MAPFMKLFNWLLLSHWRAIDQEHEVGELKPSPEVASAAPSGPGTGRTGKKKKKGKVGRAPEPSPSPPQSYDWRPLVVLVTVAISLSIQEYWGYRGVFFEHFPNQDASPWDYQLASFGWWTGFRVLGYVILPVITIWLMPGERVRDYFVSFKGFFTHLRIYTVLFLMVLPLVIAASRRESFYMTYPFFRWANMSMGYFLAWEALYAIQFLSLEFFFRGYMLNGLRHRFGSGAIFVMCVPYCMIHFGKPMPETLGAIFAGIILGTLALRTRSIWGGVVIHIAVAVTMDALALGQCPEMGSGDPCLRR